MPKGRKTGGRQKGTPNKATQDVAARLKALGCDPIEGMAALALDTSNPPELRGRMFSELAQYVAPKRKAIEHSAEPGTFIGYVILSPEEDESSEAWQARQQPTLQ